MLGTAQQTLENLTAQAAFLRTRMVKAQQTKSSMMAREKAAFEGKLRAQELANRDLVAQNHKIAHEIEQLQRLNAEKVAHAKELEGVNKVMRGELLALSGKLGTAQEFFQRTLESTDDSKAKDLLVLKTEKAIAPTGIVPKAQITMKRRTTVQQLHPLQPPIKAVNATPNNTFTETQHEMQVARTNMSGVAATTSEVEADAADALDQDNEDDRDEEDDQAPALIMVAKKRVRMRAVTTPQAESDARELIKVLQKSVSALSNQEHASEAQLKKLFLRSFQAGAKRRQMLVKEQKTLNGTRASLVLLQGELHEAESHLLATKQHLGQSLHDVGVYLQKLVHLALAPSGEAPRLLTALPTDVVSSAAPATTATS